MSVKLKGFTPAPDVLLKKYGPITALVYGKIWRYTQAYGKSDAGQRRMAEELGIKDRTLRNHLVILLEDGYIQDLTPGLKNKPHTYITTGKLRIEVEVSMNNPELDSASIAFARNLIPPRTESNSVEDTEESNKEKIEEVSAPNGAPRTQPTAQQQMVEALALVTGFDLKINGARLGKAASKLVSAGYTRPYVMDKYGASYSWWYQNDFRGRKGDKPTPEQVTETIGRTVATVRQPDPIDLDGLRRAVREAKPADDGMEY